MKFSELWLREWANPAVDSVTLVNKMTMSGLKVNTVEPATSYFTDVVIGNIIDLKMHPNDCNLYINKIDVGSYGIFNVISNSKKCRKNIRVAVALVGANLPGNIKIKCIQIQGEKSEGMLCSFESLNILYSDASNNIIELPIDAPIGQNLRDYLQLDDNIIDISIPQNRGDCLNVIGLAHDIAAMYRLSFPPLNIDYIIPSIDDIMSISVDVPEACPSYFGRILKNINISIPTPLWMKEKLRRSGIQLTNIVINIINYVLLEFGQPIHVFNVDDIDGGINVRFATQGEKIKGEYDNEIILTKDTLIIADDAGPLEIAGTSIGNFTIIDTSKTSNLFLGSAFFHPMYVMDSSKRYKVTSHFSQRYERYSVNPEVSKLALDRVTYLLLTTCGGLSSRMVNITHKRMLPKRININLHRKKIDKLLGYSIPNNEIVDILFHLGCEIKSNQKCSLWKVLVPIWRFDIRIEEDIIEEIVRLYGYDKITEISMYAQLNIIESKESTLLSRIKMFLADRGYQEIITYSFVNPKIQNLLFPDNNPVKIINPITIDMSVMRSTLLVGLLNTLLYNQNRQQKNIRLFESGQCFMFESINSTRICQHQMLSGIMAGTRFNDHWNSTNCSLDFYDIKGDVESLLDILGQLPQVTFKRKIYTGLHPGQSAEIFLKEEYIGFIGVIHPILAKKLNLQSQTCVFELFWEKISKNLIKHEIINVPKFPISRRDISIIVPENISVGKIIFECQQSIKDQLIDIKLFDIYRGEGIPYGCKSISISLYISDCSCTLKEQEISIIVKNCLSVLQIRFGALLRDA